MMTHCFFPGLTRGRRHARVHPVRRSPTFRRFASHLRLGQGNIFTKKFFTFFIDENQDFLDTVESG